MITTFTNSKTVETGEVDSSNQADWTWTEELFDTEDFTNWFKTLDTDSGQSYQIRVTIMVNRTE